MSESKPLTIGERLEGNILFYNFMGFDVEHTDEWHLNVSKYDKSWQELMVIATKLYHCTVADDDDSYSEEATALNSANFSYIHRMAHEILGPGGFEFLYRESVKLLKVWNNYESGRKRQTA